MPSKTVRETGTLSAVVNAPQPLSKAMQARLLADRQAPIDAHEQFCRTVAEACAASSVRKVADFLGVSPTTVQKWKDAVR